MSKKSWLYTGFFTALAIGFYFIISALIPEFARGGTPPRLVLSGLLPLLTRMGKK